MQTNQTGNGPLLTRRGFVKGTLGAAAALGAAAVVSSGPISALQGEEAPVRAWGAEDDDVLAVREDQILTTGDFEFLDTTEGSLVMTAQAHLPYGTVVWSEDDQFATCLLPCDTSDPLMQVGMLSLSSGDMSVVLEKAAGSEEGFQVFDARLNSNGAIWVEADILNERWRVYTARFDDAWTLRAPQVAAEGDGNWQMPSIVASGSYAFWQMSPVADGNAAEEDSFLMRGVFGGSKDDAKSVCESQGRFACAPSSSATGIVAAPRANSSSTSYEIVHIDADSGQVTDSLKLPSAMRPAYVSFGPTGFSFSFEDIYNYGDGISNLGTYTPVSEGSDEWFHFARTPFTAPAWSGKWFFVKSTSVVAAMDLGSRHYLAIEPENTSQGYGEFLASNGNGWRVVTYNNIDYTPLNGQHIKECNVRIWQPA